MFVNGMYSDEEEILKKRVSKKRFVHSINVAYEAYRLAEKYGVNRKKAYFAGLLHDICKEDSCEDLRNAVKLSIMDVTLEELNSKSLWHSIAGAEFLKMQLNIGDSDILNAVRYHTVGRGGMSRLEKVIYIADLISADRVYEDVGNMRKIAYADLDRAMLEGVKFCLSSVIAKGKVIPVHTLDAYNYFTMFCERKDCK